MSLRSNFTFKEETFVSNRSLNIT